MFCGVTGFTGTQHRQQSPYTSGGSWREEFLLFILQQVMSLRFCILLELDFVCVVYFLLPVSHIHDKTLWAYIHVEIYVNLKLANLKLMRVTAKWGENLLDLCIQSWLKLVTEAFLYSSVISLVIIDLVHCCKLMIGSVPKRPRGKEGVYVVVCVLMTSFGCLSVKWMSAWYM